MQAFSTMLYQSGDSRGRASDKMHLSLFLLLEKVAQRARCISSTIIANEPRFTKERQSVLSPTQYLQGAIFSANGCTSHTECDSEVSALYNFIARGWFFWNEVFIKRSLDSHVTLSPLRHLPPCDWLQCHLGLSFCWETPPTSLHQSDETWHVCSSLCVLLMLRPWLHPNVSPHPIGMNYWRRRGGKACLSPNGTAPPWWPGLR